METLLRARETTKELLEVIDELIELEKEGAENNDPRVLMAIGKMMLLQAGAPKLK